MQFKNVSYNISSIFFMRRQTKSHKEHHPFCSSPSSSISCFLFCTLSVTPLSTRLNLRVLVCLRRILLCVYNFRLELMNFVQIKQSKSSRVLATILRCQSLLLSGACSMLQFSAQCCIIPYTPHALLCASHHSLLCPFSSYSRMMIQSKN